MSNEEITEWEAAGIKKEYEPKSVPRCYRIARKMRDAKIPSHLVPELELYLEEGVIPGNFLRSVLSNNLWGSIMHADSHGMESSITGGIEAAELEVLVRFLWVHAPEESWGSEEAVHAWGDSIRTYRMDKERSKAKWYQLRKAAGINDEET